MNKGILIDIKADYDLCINKPDAYKKKVDDISNKLGIKAKNRLKNDNCAAYIIGKPESKFVIFNLNPGYVRDWNVNEDREARKSWEDYQNLYLNFFKHNYSEHSQFYNGLWQLFCGLSNVKDKWEFFDANLVNLKLIPYHSEGLSLPNKLSSIQLHYSNGRFLRMLEYTRESKRQLLIFNGKVFQILLSRNGYLDRAEKVNIIKNFNIYLFVLDDIPCILFETFLGAGHYEGLTNEHLRTTIPNLIRQRYGKMT